MSDGRITKETLPSRGVTDSVSVGAAAVQMVTAAQAILQGAAAGLSGSQPYRADKGVEIRAANGNSGKVYVGYASTVTAGSDPGSQTDGYELAAGQSVFLQADDLTKIWLIASASSQVAFYIAQ